MNSWTACLLSLATGFFYLSFEIIWVRFFSVSTSSDPMVFGILLGSYLGGLGFGAGIVRRFLSREVREAAGTLFLLLLFSALLCYMVMPVTIFMSTLWFYAYRYGYALVALAALSFGGVFPLIIGHAVKDDEDAGTRVAWIYTANIIGSALGTIITGYLLLDCMPIGGVSALMSSGILALAFTMGVSPSLKNRWAAAALPVLCSALIAILNGPLHSHLYEKLMYMPRSRIKPSFERVIENRSGVIAVTRERAVYGNGAYDGYISTSLSPKINPEIENAYLVFLFKPDPERVLEIGLSAGAWAQVIVHNPAVQSLTSVEINPGYLKLIKSYDEVHSLLKNPRFRLVIDDGRRWLSNNPGEKFDVIIMNTTFHWRSHATDLLSIEFMRMLKKHLRPGGIVYLNTTMSKSVIRTVTSCFDYTSLYRGYVIASDSPMRVDRLKFGALLRNYRIDEKPVLDLARKPDRDIYAKMTGLRLYGSRDDLLRLTEGHRTVSDDNMTTEFTWWRNRFGNRLPK